MPGRGARLSYVGSGMRGSIVCVATSMGVTPCTLRDKRPPHCKASEAWLGLAGKAAPHGAFEGLDTKFTPSTILCYMEPPALLSPSPRPPARTASIGCVPTRRG